MANASITDKQLLAWWAHRQGLDGSLAGKHPGQVLESVGWARSVGGVNPYLTLFARGGFSRNLIDKSVAACSIHELPSARGCTYVIPASEFSLALTVAQGFSDESEMKVARKLGVTDKEIDDLCLAVLMALKAGPLEPQGIRESTGSQSRSLGPEGQKKGLSTTLPLALGQLQVTGKIRRIPTNGRLDQQRYQYALWQDNPMAKGKRSKEEANAELARLYFRWIGPATLAEFQWFSGLGVKAAKTAVEPLNLLALDEDRHMLPEDLDALRSFKAAKDKEYRLVASIDSMVLLRRNHSSLLPPESRDLEILGDKGKAALSSLSDLPSHAIISTHGELCGFWEYDQATESIAWGNFAGNGKAIGKAVQETETFVREQLGDARSFSLDSPKTRGPRIEAVKAIGK